jgi:hypothetical protein
MCACGTTVVFAFLEGSTGAPGNFRFNTALLVALVALERLPNFLTDPNLEVVVLLLLLLVVLTSRTPVDG